MLGVRLVSLAGPIFYLAVSIFGKPLSWFVLHAKCFGTDHVSKATGPQCQLGDKISVFKTTTRVRNYTTMVLRLLQLVPVSRSDIGAEFILLKNGACYWGCFPYLLQIFLTYDGFFLIFSFKKQVVFLSNTMWHLLTPLLLRYWEEKIKGFLTRILDRVLCLCLSSAINYPNREPKYLGIFPILPIFNSCCYCQCALQVQTINHYLLNVLVLQSQACSSCRLEFTRAAPCHLGCVHAHDLKAQSCN